MDAVARSCRVRLYEAISCRSLHITAPQRVSGYTYGFSELYYNAVYNTGPLKGLFRELIAQYPVSPNEFDIMKTEIPQELWCIVVESFLQRPAL